MPKKNVSDIIDVRELLRQYASKWYLFVISVVCCMAVALLFCRWKKDVYGVRANVLIQQEEQNPMAAMGGLGDLLGSTGNTDDEVFVLSSHSVYRDVMRDLNLNRTHFVHEGFLRNILTYPDYPIDVYPTAGICDTLRTTLTFKVKVKENGDTKINVKNSRKETVGDVKDVKLPYTLDTRYGQFTVAKTEYFPKNEEVESKIVVRGYHSAAEMYAEDINIEIANKRSNVIQMSFNTPNSDLGEALLQAIIDKYNERGILEKNLQGQKTAKFIEDRLNLLTTDLGTAELNIQNYKEKQGLVDVATEATYNTTKKAGLESKIFESETELEMLKMTRDFVSDYDNRFEPIPFNLSGSLSGTIGGYNNQVIRLKEMLKTVSPENLAVKKLTDAMEANRKNLIASLGKTIDDSKAALKDLKAEMNTVTGKLGNIPQQERDYVDLERQRKVKQEIYVYLLKRQEENAIVLANAVPKGLIVDVPYTLIEPVSTKKWVILFAALVFALCLPPVYLYLLKFIRNRVETRSEIERKISAPVIGEMCWDHSGRSVVVGPTDTSSASELFRLIRSNLMFMLNDKNDKVVLMTSSSSGEGKSYISINLAATMAMLGKKVLLVGMDIRNPQLANYLGLSAPKGLTQYLSADMPEKDIIIKSPIKDFPTMDIIVAGPIPPNPGELLASHKVDGLFQDLRTQYDYIFVDSAPVGMVSDTFSLDRVADATIFITRVNYTKASDVEEIENIYTDNRLKKLSVIVNGTKSKKQYGYGYGKK